MSLFLMRPMQYLQFFLSRDIELRAVFTHELFLSLVKGSHETFLKLMLC
jgi:hypothetical protein